MTYKVLGMDYGNDEVASVELYEAETSEQANGWVVGYVRSGDYGGYDAINVVSSCGFTKAEYIKDFGWTHY